MDKEKAIQTVNQQLSDLTQLADLTTSAPRFRKWRRNTRVILENVFGKESSQVREYDTIDFTPGIYTSDEDRQIELNKKGWENGHSQMRAFLQSIIYEIENFWDQKGEGIIQNNPVGFLTRLFDRFCSVARQLQSRHANRQTISIDDEYDVQDLLHALLKIYFDDVRPEEWTPSYAGKSSRMDFLLKKENLVVEVKKTRKDLTAKEIGDQLIVDIGRYAEHPDCKNLLCFVYDPEGRIGNPTGLESDLSRSENGLTVLIFVRPKPS
jgi:hypothetical protein